MLSLILITLAITVRAGQKLKTEEKANGYLLLLGGNSHSSESFYLTFYYNSFHIHVLDMFQHNMHKVSSSDS